MGSRDLLQKLRDDFSKISRFIYLFFFALEKDLNISGEFVEIYEGIWTIINFSSAFAKKFFWCISKVCSKTYLDQNMVQGVKIFKKITH